MQTKAINKKSGLDVLVSIFITVFGLAYGFGAAVPLLLLPTEELVENEIFLIFGRLVFVSIIKPLYNVMRSFTHLPKSHTYFPNGTIGDTIDLCFMVVYVSIFVVTWGIISGAFTILTESPVSEWISKRPQKLSAIYEAVGKELYAFLCAVSGEQETMLTFTKTATHTIIGAYPGWWCRYPF